MFVCVWYVCMCAQQMVYLILQVKGKKLSAIAFYLKVALYCGWSVVATRTAASTLPLLQRSYTALVCTSTRGCPRTSLLQCSI